MGITPNLKLTTISEQDNPKVKDFFQDLAGDVSTSNMQKIDEAVKKIQDVANAAIASSEKGKAGGVATLGSDKKVVKKQLPDLNYLPDTSTLENIPDGATRKAVTQAEKNTWNAKSNFSGSYNDLTNKPTLDFIPTSDKGIAGGVAPLGEDKKVPGIYLPAMDYIPTSEKGAYNGVASMVNGKIPSDQYTFKYSEKVRRVDFYGTEWEILSTLYAVGKIGILMIDGKSVGKAPVGEHELYTSIPIATSVAIHISSITSGALSGSFSSFGHGTNFFVGALSVHSGTSNYELSIRGVDKEAYGDSEIHIYGCVPVFVK